MKIKELELIRDCEQCGEIYATDEPFKKLCYKCWLKQEHPESYEARYELHEIACEKCGEVFVDESWKKLCYRCWLEDYNERKYEDLEEREQFDR